MPARWPSSAVAKRPVEHRLVELEATLDALYDRLIRGACAVAGFEPQILFEITDCQTAQGFVAAGMGIAALPHLALHPLHPDVVVRELDHAPVRRVLAVRLAGSAGTPAGFAALDLLTDLLLLCAKSGSLRAGALHCRSGRQGEVSACPELAFAFGAKR